MINQKIRICDICISIIVLTVLSPIILIITILIFIFDGRPIFFKQLRVGYGGKKFSIYKFRTMSNNITKNEELRLTHLGKLLRKSSLDELPQLINVLYKEMSIVGPRPLPQNIEERIKISLKLRRRKILPGITGISQINYTGKNRRLDQKIKLDIMYIENYNLYNYLKILLKTPTVLIKRFYKNKSSIIK